MLSAFCRTALGALALGLCLAARAPAQAVLPEGELRLHAGDAVRVLIRDEPGLGGEFRVDADGYALLPILGRVRLSDRSFAALREELAAAYAVELSDPVVQITPLLRVAVLGEVRQPGLFSVDPTHSLAEVLALAGGLTPTAHRGRISLTREGRVAVARLDADSRELRVPLRSGDQIVVGRRGWLSEHSGVLIGATASVAAAALTSLIIR